MRHISGLAQNGIHDLRALSCALGANRHAGEASRRRLLWLSQDGVHSGADRFEILERAVKEVGYL